MTGTEPVRHAFRTHKRLSRVSSSDWPVLIWGHIKGVMIEIRLTVCLPLWMIEIPSKFFSNFNEGFKEVSMCNFSLPRTVWTRTDVLYKLCTVVIYQWRKGHPLPKLKKMKSTGGRAILLYWIIRIWRCQHVTNAVGANRITSCGYSLINIINHCNLYTICCIWVQWRGAEGINNSTAWVAAWITLSTVQYITVQCSPVQ